MKKYLFSLMSLFATLGLHAEEDTFTSFGSTWIQASGEWADVEGNDGYGASAEMNFGLINFKHFGIDLSIGAEYSELDFAKNSYENYAGYLALSPYIHLYRGESFGLTLFASGFAGYENSEISGDSYKYTKHTVSYGLKAGVEFAFAKDFYIAPAIKYTRFESIDSNTYGLSVKGYSLDFDSDSTDETSAEIELGYRLTSWISLHLLYSYIFDKEFFGESISISEVKGGLRLTF